MALYLVARIADEAVAFPADTVGSVVELGPVTAVPRAPSHVAGLCALRSRVLTVIDSRAVLGLGRREGEGAQAVVVDRGGHGYAILVDVVDDVIEAPAPAACPAALAPAWRAVATGLIERDEGVLLLIDPAALVDGRPTAVMES